jgi:hypothetical protein
MTSAPISQRDVRVDFFRGLALIFIFVDHIKDNVLQYATMQNFGFADAADVFVTLAGYASFLAYTKVFDRQGWPAGLMKVGRRIGTLYIAHILLLLVCVAGLFLAALLADNVIYQEVVNLEPFFDDPWRALRKALVLSHQPAMLDILPLYVVLLLWFPLLLLLMRIHLVLALVASHVSRKSRMVLQSLRMAAAIQPWCHGSLFGNPAGFVAALYPAHLDRHWHGVVCFRAGRAMDGAAGVG